MAPVGVRRTSTSSTPSLDDAIRAISHPGRCAIPSPKATIRARINSKTRGAPLRANPDSPDSSIGPAERVAATSHRSQPKPDRFGSPSQPEDIHVELISGRIAVGPTRAAQGVLRDNAAETLDERRHELRLSPRKCDPSTLVVKPSIEIQLRFRSDVRSQLERGHASPQVDRICRHAHPVLEDVSIDRGYGTTMDQQQPRLPALPEPVEEVFLCRPANQHDVAWECSSGHVHPPVRLASAGPNDPL